MAHVYESQRNSSAPYFKRSLDTYDDFWSNQEQRHREHRRSIITLSIVMALLVVAAIVVHPVLLAFAGTVGLLNLVEIFMYRRTRPTGRLPDRPRSTTVEIELEG